MLQLFFELLLVKQFQRHLFLILYHDQEVYGYITLSANPIKWSKTFKRLRVYLNCSVFGHFVGLALKEIFTTYMLPIFLPHNP